jgi:hypothetical protein
MNCKLLTILLVTSSWLSCKNKWNSTYDYVKSASLQVFTADADQGDDIILHQSGYDIPNSAMYLVLSLNFASDTADKVSVKVPGNLVSLDTTTIAGIEVSIYNIDTPSVKLDVSNLLECNRPTSRFYWKNMQLGKCSNLEYFTNFYNESVTGHADFHTINFQNWVFDGKQIIPKLRDNNNYVISFVINFENGRRLSVACNLQTYPWRADTEHCSLPSQFLL